MKRQFKFTKKLIDALLPCPSDSVSKEVEYSDQDIAGLRLQVNRLGRKFFLFRYQHRGRKRAMKIGGYPEVTIDEARQQVIEWRSMLLKDIDPQDQRDEDTKAGLTFRQFWDNFLLGHIRANKRSAKADESRMKNHILPKFGHREMAKVTPLELQQFHDNNLAVRKMAPATANRIFEIIRRSYNLAAGSWGLLPPAANQAQGIKLHRENNKRERYLSEDEIRRLMVALDKAPNQTMADIFRLLLATGCRRSEIVNLRVEDLRLEREEFYLERNKSGRGRHVVLNSVALEIIRRRLQFVREGPLFVGRIPGQPVNNPSKAWRSVLIDAGIDPKTTTLHTLRHTHAALLTRNCSLHEIAGILGHSSVATSQRYAHLHHRQLAMKSSVVADVMRSTSPSTSALSG